MKSFVDWYRSAQGAPAKPCLVLGKGPSFSRIRDVDLGEYFVVTLNHAVREVPRMADVAHMIDVDVLDGLEDRHLYNAGHFVLPMHPHVKFNATARRLPDFVAERPKLALLEEEDRLLWYNLSTWGHAPEPGSPVVEVTYFSAEAAIRLLAVSGAKVIRTLGVDGGTQYAGEFKDLTPFTGGHASFDLQWQGIDRTVREFGLDLKKL